jgi:hypothetical protein
VCWVRDVHHFTSLLITSTGVTHNQTKQTHSAIMPSFPLGYKHLRLSFPHPFASPLIPHLTSPQHSRQRALLGGRNRKRIHTLDPDPHLGVRAVVAGERRLPVLGALVALCLVDVVGDGEQLRVGEVVGEGLALGRCPRGGTGLCEGLVWVLCCGGVWKGRGRGRGR